MNHKLQVLFTLCLLCWFIAAAFAKTNVTDQTNDSGTKPAASADLEEQTSLAYLLLLGGMLLTFLIGYLIEAVRFQYLHEAGVAILLGMAIGAVVRYASSGEQIQSMMIFDEKTFFFQLLPPIIFESGYNMKRGNFFYNMGSICLFAFAGTLISSMVIGGLVYLVSGVFHLGGNLSLIESFLFGALISATDPVTTLAIFSALKVQKNLYADVFGESVLNDAVAIIFYKTLVRFLTEDFHANSLAWAVFDFFKVFLGSVAIAVLLGLLSALLFKHIDLYKHPILEMLLVILYAFAAYLLAEGLQLSGIVAILFVGITMAHYTYGNLSKESQIVTKKLFKVAATLAETTVFIYLGLAIFSFQSSTEFAWGLILCCLPILAISRALNIFPLAFLINLCRVEEHKIPMKHQIMLWFAGLRGAIAFALAKDLQTEDKSVIFTTTLIIVLFTALVMGGLTIPLLKYLKIEMGGHGGGGHGGHGQKQEKNDHERKYSEKSWFMKIDRNYIKPFFTKTPTAQLLHSTSHEVRSNSVPLTEIKTPGRGGDGGGKKSLEKIVEEKEPLHRRGGRRGDEEEGIDLQNKFLDGVDESDVKSKKSPSSNSAPTSSLSPKATSTHDIGYSIGLGGIPPVTNTAFTRDSDSSSEDEGKILLSDF